MTLRHIEKKVREGVSFIYSIEYGEMNEHDIPDSESVVEYFVQDTDDIMKEVMNLAVISANEPKRVIVGRNTELGYTLGVYQMVEPVMTPMEWMKEMYGDDIAHGVSQAKMMDRYANYVLNIKTNGTS